MSNPALQIINDITATGARFVLDADGIGLDRIIPAHLLELARQHKQAIKLELEAQQKAIRAEGIKRLKVAAHGLPVDLDELLSFFADDLQDIATGAINPGGLQQAVEWFTYSHLKRTHKPVEPSPQEIGMVRCTDCKQSNCSREGRQSSPAYRWCSDYNKAWRAR